jgi:hypothetical protein
VATIARELTGDLRCLRCGYNLKGLSIRATCPECSLPVKATILAIVDPHAAELAPLRSRRLLAWALVAWTGGPVLTAAMVWWLRAGEVLSNVWKTSLTPVWLPVVGAVGLTVSGLAAAALVRPHAGIPLWRQAAALLGVLLYVPLVLLFWRLHGYLDVLYPTPYFASAAPDRPWTRMAIVLLAAAIILLLRPNARQVAMRSYVVRTGRVDRQSMLALAGAFALGAVADAAGLVMPLLAAHASDIVVVSRVALVALSGVLATLGLANMLIDSLRLRPILAAKGLDLSDILETNRQRDERLAGTVPEPTA